MSADSPAAPFPARLVGTPKQLEQRGGARYSDAACNLIESIHTNRGDIQYVDVRNNGCIEGLPSGSAVEVACRITANGPQPIATGELKPRIAGYVQMMKGFERMVVEAAITGDPIPTAERDEVKNVYQFNSRKLAQYIVSLAGEGREMPAPITVFGALNLNARNFEVELRRAAEKLENGMSGFLTQPVLSAQAVENLRKSRETLGADAKILAGIMPVVSQRNAIFMENEINGIHVEDWIIEKFAGLDRAQGEELGLAISLEMAKAALPYADGLYLMTPFNRVALMERLIARLRTEVTG